MPQASAFDAAAFLGDLRSSPSYAGQIRHVHVVPARDARYAEPTVQLGDAVLRFLRSKGIGQLYAHQAEAVDLALRGQNVVVATGTASGKSLCYLVPIIELMSKDPTSRFLLVFPTKALCQDQLRRVRQALKASRIQPHAAGVYDGDTPTPERRRLRDEARIVLTNPDMLHAALMPHHAKWSGFLAQLRYLVLDELHVYSGMFGSNVANLLRRFMRVCCHYGSDPRITTCSGTIGNPQELAERLTGLDFVLVEEDGSPRGRRTFVFWNPPVIRPTPTRSRRSANVEAHELMTALVRRGVPTITFSKAKMTAEMIHRYVCESLLRTAPHLVPKVAAYRGGYLPEERREIERRLFSGELLGVSSTRALELGIDVGALDASILVGYPGTLASFYQQAGRAGRGTEDALVVLVGLDTPANQYVMHHPEYIFGRPVEQAVIDPDNPFVVMGHLRCAVQELPLRDDEIGLFGPHAEEALETLQDSGKIQHIRGAWYHASGEIPQHEVPLRGHSDVVTITDEETGELIGTTSRLDAPSIVHPNAVYMHRGDTYLVTSLDLARNSATVKRADVDYYTQPLGRTDVDHVDRCLKEKPFGTGRAFWGEVTACLKTEAFEKIRFYELDAISWEGLNLPTEYLDTMAFWLVPPERLMQDVARAGLDVHAGLRGVGYAIRMMLPLFVTCDTLDFSHSIGAANAPWNAVFVYERHPLGLGFTKRAYERLHDIIPAVLSHVRECECRDGCPCCVGKPLRPETVWNVERGEGSIPNKQATLMILEGLLSDSTDLNDDESRRGADRLERLDLKVELTRYLGRGRRPKAPDAAELARGGAGVRGTDDDGQEADRNAEFHRELRRRLWERKRQGQAPAGAKPGGDDEGRIGEAEVPRTQSRSFPPQEVGDPLAAEAMRRLRAAKREAAEKTSDST